MSEMMIGGPEALKVVEELLAREDPKQWLKARGFLPEQVANRVKYAIYRDIPLAPIFHRGRNGHKYDSYTCARCGAGVLDHSAEWCGRCGQRLSDPYLGRRKTTEEQMEHSSDEMKRAIRNVEAVYGEET